MRFGEAMLMVYNALRLGIRRAIVPGVLQFDWIQFLSPKTDITLEGRNSRVALGRGLRTRAGVALLAAGGRIEIGAQVFINRNAFVTSLESIRIGDRCSIGPNVMIFDHDHDFRELTGTEFKTGPVDIGQRVWVGANVVILRNTRIGDGSVIGAGCVVQGDIPARSLVTTPRLLTIRPIAALVSTAG